MIQSSRAAPGPWYAVSNLDDVPSPALLVYPDRAEENLRRMVALAGGPDRLRPHVKTHKLAAFVKAQIALGVPRVKCATIAEAEMAAGAGATDVLLAYQPVGPNAARLRQLTDRFPRTSFSALVDDERALEAIGAAFANAAHPLPLLVDLDVGMHRSGIAPSRAGALYARLAATRGVVPGGLHAYDGHLRDSDPAERRRQCDLAFAPVAELRNALQRDGLPVPRVVAGGTPTFPIHAARPDVECSPGTCVFWDAGYGATLPDLDFLPAALVLTRVVSRPAGRVCLDLGHKAIASEGPHPRVVLLAPGREDALAATAVGHSEEHLVIESPDAAALKVGDALLGVPWHICPTVALHAEAVVVRDGRAVERWPVEARARRISI